ncbi:MAG: DUF4395 family protein [Chloroflexi bacterium]|nr:DUF4395 family protein [Chloroflexota bacterium]
MNPEGRPPEAPGNVSTGDRAERRFHQGVLATWYALGIFVASTAVAPWIIIIGVLVQLAGSVNCCLSLPRALHRWLIAPARRQRAPEPRAAFDRADAMTGTVALAGVMFVVAGMHPLGWALVGVAIISLALDAALDRGPLRSLADLLARLAGPAQP